MAEYYKGKWVGCSRWNIVRNILYRKNCMPNASQIIVGKQASRSTALQLHIWWWSSHVCTTDMLISVLETNAPRCPVGGPRGCFVDECWRVQIWRIAVGPGWGCYCFVVSWTEFRKRIIQYAMTAVLRVSAISVDGMEIWWLIQRQNKPEVRVSLQNRPLLAPWSWCRLSTASFASWP
jgi:hypothetical protein